MQKYWGYLPAVHPLSRFSEIKYCVFVSIIYYIQVTTLKTLLSVGEARPNEPPLSAASCCGSITGVSELCCFRDET